MVATGTVGGERREREEVGKEETGCGAGVSFRRLEESEVMPVRSIARREGDCILTG